VVEVLTLLLVRQQARMALAQVLAGGDQKAGRTAGGVARSRSVGLRRRHLDHQADDVPRRPELPVLAGRSDLPEHVLVEVALRVAILHRHRGEQVDHFREQRRRRNREAGVLHVVGVGRVVSAQRAQEREDVLADHGIHFRRRQILETRPAQLVVGPAPTAADAVLALREDPAGHRHLQAGRTVLLQCLQVIQPAQKEQVGDLLHHLQRIRDSAGPESVPDPVDLTSEFAGDHQLP
jgi:hypothetical protein